MRTILGFVFVCVVVIGAVGFTGCGGVTAGSFQSMPTSVPLAERNYKFVMHGLRGEACRISVFGFGINDRSYAAAIKEIHKQVPQKYRPDYQLVNVVDDWRFHFFLLAWENCTVVSADVVVLSDPGQASPPPSGEAGNDEATQVAEKDDLPAAAEEEKGGGEASEIGLKKDIVLDDVTAASNEAVEQTTKKVKSKKSKDASKSPYNE